MAMLRWVEDNIGKKKVKPTRKFNPSNSNTRPISVPSPMEEDSDQSPKRSWKKQRRPQSRSPVRDNSEQDHGRMSRIDNHGTPPKWSRRSGHRDSHQEATRASLGRVERGASDRTHSTGRPVQSEATRASSGRVEREASNRTRSTGRPSQSEVTRASSGCVEREASDRTRSTGRPLQREVTRASSGYVEEEARDRSPSYFTDCHKRKRSPVHRDRSNRLQALEPLPKERRVDEEARDRTPLTITVASEDISGAPVNEHRGDLPRAGRSRKRGKRKIYPCPMVGCEETTLRLKWHVLHQHVPEIFNEDLMPSTELSSRRYAALSILAKTLHGPSAQVDGLVATLNKFDLIGNLGEIKDNQVKAMREMCLVMDWPMPDVFCLKPMNSAACLIHWRALTALLQNLPPGVREDFRQTFQDSKSNIPAPVGEADISQLRESSPDPTPARLVYDSYFHLDRLQWSMNLSQESSFSQTMAAIGPIPVDYQLDVAGGTAVFCDIDFYPTPERINSLISESVSVAIGVHPKATDMTEAEEMKFNTTFGHPSVTVLGEIGLDWTTHYLDWPRQERQFVKLLHYANTKQVVVVLHLRGLSSDPLGREVSLRGLALAKEILSKDQVIHLHYFSGPPDVVKAWLREFPNTYFGFTNMVKNFSFIQRQGLKAVPHNHLLLESDAPYFRPVDQDFLCNAPCLLGYTAKQSPTSDKKNMKMYCHRPLTMHSGSTSTLVIDSNAQQLVMKELWARNGPTYFIGDIWARAGPI